MNVVFSNGTKGTLPSKLAKNLYIQDRFTKNSWKKLENEMNLLHIIKFDDPVLSKFGAEMVSIEYVRNQIAAH